jgi:hypothetical protein
MLILLATEPRNADATHQPVASTLALSATLWMACASDASSSGESMGSRAISEDSGQGPRCLRLVMFFVI